MALHLKVRWASVPPSLSLAVGLNDPLGLWGAEVLIPTSPFQ